MVIGACSGASKSFRARALCFAGVEFAPVFEDRFVSMTRSSANDPHDWHVEAAGKFTGNAEAYGAAGFGALDRGDRHADVPAPAIVGEILLAHQSGLAELTQLKRVQNDPPLEVSIRCSNGWLIAGGEDHRRRTILDGVHRGRVQVVHDGSLVGY